MNKFVKTFISFGVTTSLSATLVGCNKTEQQQKLNEKLLYDIIDEQANPKQELKSYMLIGVEVEKTGFTFDVVFNGVALYGEDYDRAYATATYQADSAYFNAVDKFTDKSTMVTLLTKIVNENDLCSYELTPVNSLDIINKAVTSNTVSPFENCTKDSCIMYSLSTPSFDDQTNNVTFETKSLMTLKEGTVKVGLGLGFGNSAGLGVGIFSNTTSGDFIVEDRYTLTLDKAKYEQVKLDPTQVYDTFTQMINDRDESRLTATRTAVYDVSYANIDLMNNVNLSKFEDTPEK